MKNILYDTFFKRIFVSQIGIKYMSMVISKLYNLDYEDMINNIEVINNEHNRDNIDIKSSMSDVIYKYKNKIFIIEMNKVYTKESLYKNHFYLFYKHIFDAENANSYKSEMETYLIDIDNFDILDKLDIKDIKKTFIYDSKLLVNDSKISLYPNIHASRINLDYLGRRYYNKDVLTNIERDCLIFVENDVEKLKYEIKNDNIERMIKMFKMVYEDGKIFPVFNEEQFHENEKKEMFEQGIKQGIEQGIEQGQEKKQFDIARILKKRNFSNKDIVDITNLSEEQVMDL